MTRPSAPEALYLGKSANYISVPGNLIIGPAAGPTAFARLGQVGGLGGTTVTVNANSLFDLFGYYQSLTTLNLRDGGSVHTGVGLLDFPSGGAINVGSLNAFGSHVSASITGAIGLPLNATLSFNINAFAPCFPFASGPELDVSATIPRPTENLGFAPAGITKNGLGQMRLSGNNTYAGSTFINGGTLSVDGTQPQSPVLVNSGTLGGSGTVGPIYMSGAAVVAPGDDGPGILTCSNLNAGITASGVLRLELNGTTPGSGYDQLNVRGTVNLAGVTLERSLGFSAPTRRPIRYHQQRRQRRRDRHLQWPAGWREVVYRRHAVPDQLPIRRQTRQRRGAPGPGHAAPAHTDD